MRAPGHRKRQEHGSLAPRKIEEWQKINEVDDCKLHIILCHFHVRLSICLMLILVPQNAILMFQHKVYITSSNEKHPVENGRKRQIC